jgi:hypothetical protein
MKIVNVSTSRLFIFIVHESSMKVPVRHHDTSKL